MHLQETPRKLRRPNWGVLRGSGEAAQVARSALAAEMDRRIGEEQPDTWSDLVSLGLGVSRAVLGEEPRPDPRPWVRGCEPELSSFDQEVSRASLRKRRMNGGLLLRTFVAVSVVVLRG